MVALIGGLSPADLVKLIDGYATARALRGDSCLVFMFLDGERVLGLSPLSLVEVDGVCTSTWVVHDAGDLARIDGRDIELHTTFAAPIGEQQPAIWLGKVTGIGIAGRAAVTVTITGVRRTWGQP